MIGACSDWAMHLFRAPGRQLELLERAQANWLKLAHCSIGSLMDQTQEKTFRPGAHDTRWSHAVWDKGALHRLAAGLPCGSGLVVGRHVGFAGPAPAERATHRLHDVTQQWHPVRAEPSQPALLHRPARPRSAVCWHRRVAGRTGREARVVVAGTGGMAIEAKQRSGLAANHRRCRAWSSNDCASPRHLCP